MKPPRIVSAKAIDDRVLAIEFTNHEMKKYDISKLLDKPMFTLLKNPTFFRSFQIEPGGYALIWNNDLDISEYELWENGVSVTDKDIADFAKITHS
jgi:hypothetical protein